MAEVGHRYVEAGHGVLMDTALRALARPPRPERREG